MRINNAIRKIMKDSKFTQQRMADILGKKHAKEIGSRLMSKNMSFDRALEMLDALGYEIVVQPVTAGQRKEGAIVIDGKDDEES